MPRPKGPPTKLKRLLGEDARKAQAIARKLRVPFREVMHHIAGAEIDRLYRHMRAGGVVELGVLAAPELGEAGA